MRATKKTLKFRNGVRRSTRARGMVKHTGPVGDGPLADIGLSTVSLGSPQNLPSASCGRSLTVFAADGGWCHHGPPRLNPVVRADK